jgi:hypothetical protein
MTEPGNEFVLCSTQVVRALKFGLKALVVEAATSGATICQENQGRSDQRG